MSSESKRRRSTVSDYSSAYSSGVNPVDVVERSVALARRLDSGPEALGAFIILDSNDVLSQASRAAARLGRGESRGPLDGVPVAIKDEFDVAGFPTGAGTSFRGKDLATHDATVVARLRQAGAILFGKTTMTEIGIGGTGMNPATKTPRNPWDMSRLTGGSSSGSAAAVAAGIVPIALGSDAGGSIRIPAALCGIYGLKPTYGRIPTRGGALLAWTLDHLGPLGTSIDDLAHFYDAVAGPSDDEPESQFQPPPQPSIGTRESVEGLRLAWCPEFADDADPHVYDVFHAALEALQQAGAVVETVDLRHVSSIQKAGYITIASEGAASQRDWLRDHRGDYSLDVRMVLAVGERFSAVDYIHAQRVRELIKREFGAVLGQYDAFVNPTTACTAPVIPNEAFGDGIVDTAMNSKVSRYTFAGTLTGFPGLTLPCGLADGLPVGFHLMTPAWSEARLLGMGRAIDSILPDVGLPPIYSDILASKG